MKSRFYMRAAYQMMMDRLPTCFVDLDDGLASILETADEMLLHPAIRQGEHLCRRMAGVDYYAAQIATKMIMDEERDAALEIEMLLVGYMSSCKAVLDAAAIVLNQLFALELEPKQQDFRQRRFRSALEAKNYAAACRYSQWEELTKEVVQWRDAVIHREVPVVLPRASWLSINGEDRSKVALVLDPNPDPFQLLHSPENFNWVDPLYLHRKWHVRLVALCDEVCKDILSCAGVPAGPVPNLQL